jgi:hypothetical protein
LGNAENGGMRLSLAETFTKRRYRKRRQTTENWRPLTGDRGRIVSGRRSSVSGRRLLLGYGDDRRGSYITLGVIRLAL